MKPYRVLTIDGGGMRGLYTATLLKTLAHRFNSKLTTAPDIGAHFDLICGTSTGAILACGLAAGIPLDKIRDLYTNHGRSIFPESIPPKNKAWHVYNWARKFRRKPSADAAHLEKVLAETFGTETIKEVYERRKIGLCIPTINATNSRAWVFKTPHNPGKNRDDNYSLVKVCLASSAAPILFPIANFQNPDDQQRKDYFVDGGLWANNPVIVGLSEALGLLKQDQPLDILSLGTCDAPSGDPHSIRNPNWGLLDWRGGISIVEMALSAQSFGYNFAAKFIARFLSQSGKKTRVLRLEQTNKSPEQYSAIGIDRADDVAINTLNELASADADAIHSKTMLGDEEHVMLKEIFSNPE